MSRLQLPHMTMANRLVNLFHSDAHSTKLILGQMAFVLALGFGWNAYSGEPLQSNVHVMGHMLPAWMWAVMWVLYCVLRLQSSVNDGQTQFVKYSTTLMGMWLWGCMLFAGLMMEVHDNTVFLYMGPMQIEIWVLLQTVLWWTKYDPEVLKTVPGALTPAPADENYEDRERPWAETKVFPER
jgi:hypothetical protein